MKLKDSIIIILAVVIAIVVGVFVGFKLSENRMVNSETNNNENINKENVETEKDFSLVEAKKLMDNYLYSTPCKTDIYISDLSDEFNKNLVVLNNVKSQTMSCLSIYGESVFDHLDGFACFEDAKFYDYDEMLIKKKELFGKDSELEKNVISHKYYKYDYISKMNGFVALRMMGGGSCYIPVENTVQSAKIKGDELTIFVVEKEFDRDTYINGEKNVITEIKREYKFKKQDTGYYLYSVEEQG